MSTILYTLLSPLIGLFEGSWDAIVTQSGRVDATPPMSEKAICQLTWVRPDRVHNAPRSCELGHPPSSAVATSLLVGGIDAKIPFLQPINLGCSRSVSTTFRHHLKGVGPAGGLCQSLIVSDG
jgi:hypothetical protein